jgi:hypothetical protein
MSSRTHKYDHFDDLTERYGADRDDESPWEVHIATVTERYGRRDPECMYCGERVWMALQGLFGGGVWTTDPDAEGPASSGLNGDGTRCPSSPDREHDCRSHREAEARWIAGAAQPSQVMEDWL